MKFTRIQLENMFAYRGVQEIDLSGCKERKNIILISGRNGAGKTSLINAIKLLFLGATDDRLRRMGFPPITLTSNQYVRGLPGVWSGLINSSARNKGANQASVSILWEDQSDKQIEAKRTWRLTGPTYKESLQLFVDGKAVMGDEISFQLAEILPRDFVPFFFFDGEQIRELAEAEEAIKASQLEQILNLSFVKEIEQAVSIFVRERRRDALPEATKVEISRCEGDRATKEAEMVALQQQRQNSHESIHDAESRKQELIRDREELRVGVSDAERKVLESRLNLLNTQRAELARKISEDLPTEIPFLANLRLTLRTYSELEALLAARQTEPGSIIEDLSRELPKHLLDEGPYPKPPLLQSQIRHLKMKLNSLLAAYIPAKDERAGPRYLRTIDPTNAHALRDRFLIWATEGTRRLATTTAELEKMYQLTVDALQTEEDLSRASVASEAHLERFRKISKELEDLENELLVHYADIGKFDEKVSQLSEAISELTLKIEQLEGEHEQATRTKEIVQFARHVEAVLGEYRSSQRESRRVSVEQSINNKVAILLADHGQIRHIQLDNSFMMTYYDDQEAKVGRASISAGMKQLIATALLWALKEESGKNIPVVIDTPLARIDRRNRARLLESYYPNAGEQVIVLPTDAEIDEKQLFQLAPHIAKKFRIENTDGDSARFVCEEIYV